MFINVFRNRKRAAIDAAAYAADAARMAELARAQPGFISYKHYHADDGEAVSISEWASAEAALAWRRNAEHLAVQAKGRAEYYQSYASICCADPRVSTFVRGEPWA
jgi:heme-degrading monooxygenase HmoA